jgi:hypothetical protein
LAKDKAGEDEGNHAGHHRSDRPKVNADKADGVNRRHRGLVDNRPFLRCMKGYGLCLWRLGRGDEAARVFDRMLWMNPCDSQGIRFLLPAVRDGRPWENSVS